jgi:rSAM/selenodomain-associated transferase 1
MSPQEQAVWVVVFAKAPEPGRVMTRLAADIGPESAVGLYRCFLADIAAQVGRLDTSLERPVRAVFAYAGDPDHPDFEPFRHAGFEFVSQGEGDLGDRLVRMTEKSFGDGASRLIIIGTDSPTLGPAHFRGALAALDDHDVVVGPSFDGGYYMIGLRAPHTTVFEGIDWSTPRVFGQTLRHCRASSLLCEALEFWYDVDTFDDLKMLETHLFDYLRYREPEIAKKTADFVANLGERGVLAHDVAETGVPKKKDD